MEEKRNHIQKARRTKKCGIITIILIAMIGIGILLQNQEIQERLGIKTEIKAANRITSVLQSDVSKDGTPLLLHQLIFYKERQEQLLLMKKKEMEMMFLKRMILFALLTK